jgi:hypothetical protein
VIHLKPGDLAIVRSDLPDTPITSTHARLISGRTVQIGAIDYKCFSKLYSFRVWVHLWPKSIDSKWLSPVFELYELQVVKLSEDEIPFYVIEQIGEP